MKTCPKNGVLTDLVEYILNFGLTTQNKNANRNDCFILPKSEYLFIVVFLFIKQSRKSFCFFGVGFSS